VAVLVDELRICGIQGSSFQSRYGSVGEFQVSSDWGTGEREIRKRIGLSGVADGEEFLKVLWLGVL